MKDLDWGTLAKIDRRVLSGLGHDEAWQMVRVPAAEAMWSAWKRYCDSQDVSMGRGIAALIGNELASLVDHVSGSPVLNLERAWQERTEQLDVRERELEDRAAQLRRAEELLRDREVRIHRRAAETSRARVMVKVGRNELCPCGSGFKYKLCHGLLRNR